MHQTKNLSRKILFIALVCLGALLISGYSATPEELMYLGVWHASREVDAAYAQRYAFYEDGTFIFGSDERDERVALLFQSGGWSVKNSILSLRVDGEILWNGSKDKPIYIDKAVEYRQEHAITPAELSKESNVSSINIDGQQFFKSDPNTDLMDGFHIVKSLAVSSVSSAIEPDIVHEIEILPARDSSKGPWDFRVTYANGNFLVFDGQYKPLLLNGNLMACDVKTIDDRTLIPVRIIGQALGWNIEWNAASRTMTIQKLGRKIVLTIGSKFAVVNDKIVRLDVPAAIFGERTYVPLRFLAESFELSVSWNTRPLPTTAGEGGFMLVSGPQGNVMIDEPYTPGVESYAQKAKDAVYALFNKYKNDPAILDNYAVRGEDAQEIFSRISVGIAEMTAVGEVSRYLVVSGPKIFLVDKHTGALYYYVGAENGGAVREFVHDITGYAVFN